MASNLTPGVQQYGVIPAGKGLSLRNQNQVTTIQDPLAPVEIGRTAAKSTYTTTNSNGADIGGNYTTGEAATITLKGTVSTKADGTQTASATSSGRAGASGATITYTVASNVASSPTLVAKGSGYVVGDVLTIDGDTGVSVTVATIS